WPNINIPVQKKVPVTENNQDSNTPVQKRVPVTETDQKPKSNFVPIYIDVVFTKHRKYPIENIIA
ncbi:19962_t:CDS:1, partial [Gigaspora rosea]